MTDYSVTRMANKLGLTIGTLQQRPPTIFRRAVAHFRV
jgi:hypothetical protein